MGSEERTVYELKFDVAGAARELGKARPAEPAAPPVAEAPSRPPQGIPGKRPAKGPARRKSVLDRSRDDRKSAKAASRKPSEIKPGFVKRVFQAGLRAIPAIGGTLALGSVVAQNIEKIGPLANVIPGLGKFVSTVAVQPAQEFKAQLQGFSNTFAQAGNLARAFGAIGSAPPLEEVGDLIPALFSVNRAQSLFQSDLTEAMLSSSTSTWQAMAKRVVTEGGSDLVERLLGITGLSLK